MKYLTILMLLTACGINGEQKVTTNDSKQNIVTSGTSYVVIQLGFITQIEDLCKGLILRDDYESGILYNKDVAKCTFEHLSVMSTNLSQSSVCQTDMSGLTPEQVLQLQSLCGN